LPIPIPLVDVADATRPIAMAETPAQFDEFPMLIALVPDPAIDPVPTHTPLSLPQLANEPTAVPCALLFETVAPKPTATALMLLVPTNDDPPTATPPMLRQTAKAPNANPFAELVLTPAPEPTAVPAELRTLAPDPNTVPSSVWAKAPAPTTVQSSLPPSIETPAPNATPRKQGPGVPVVPMVAPSPAANKPAPSTMQLRPRAIDAVAPALVSLSTPWAIDAVPLAADPSPKARA
jgi:hypothetical protein